VFNERRAQFSPRDPTGPDFLKLGGKELRKGVDSVHFCAETITEDEAKEAKEKGILLS
jgi:hypothetical protein